MTESEFLAQTKSLRRLWGWMIEERYGAKGAKILDGILDEWWNKFHNLKIKTFADCVEHVKNTYKPSWGEPFPAPGRIWEAQQAIAQQQAKDLDTADVDVDAKFQEYERILSEIRTLPTEQYNRLKDIAKPRVQAKIPSNLGPEIRSCCERGLFAGEMVRAYCEQQGTECPI